jgi:hypothetical protein
MSPHQSAFPYRFRHHGPGRRASILMVTLLFAAGPTMAAPPPPSKARSFASPEEATKALVDALRARDVKALVAIFGSRARPLISSGDEVADREERDRFLQRYDEAHSLVKEGDNAVVLQVGKDEWPFPIPLVKDGSAWLFDAQAGQEEVLRRRIGANELSAIQVCLAYVDAQREYWDRNPQRAPLLQYARRLASTPGKRDGLYWQVGPGETPSPLGELVVRAQRAGYRVGPSNVKPVPYHGYYYRILSAQGPDAPGGAYDYLVRGQMIGGFALVAYPAQWGSSGVMTFIVNHDGVVYEKNLGPKTAELADKMRTFNPDATWKKA